MNTAPRLAYVIGHVTVRDDAKWAQYRSRVGATVAAAGGRVVFRGERRAVLGGTHAHGDVVLLEFPSLAAAHAWHDSPDYQALVPLRMQAASVDLLLFEAA